MYFRSIINRTTALCALILSVVVYSEAHAQTSCEKGYEEFKSTSGKSSLCYNAAENILKASTGWDKNTLCLQPQEINFTEQEDELFLASINNSNLPDECKSSSHKFWMSGFLFVCVEKAKNIYAPKNSYQVWGIRFLPKQNRYEAQGDILATNVFYRSIENIKK